MLVCLRVVQVLKVLHLHMGPLVVLVQISDLEKEVMGTKALNTLGVHLGSDYEYIDFS